MPRLWVRAALAVDVISSFHDTNITTTTIFRRIPAPNMSISSLQDKVAIITGCSSGIGLATTRLFLERGALVFGIDVNTPPLKLTQDFSTLIFYHADLTISQAAEHAVAKCVGKHNRIDVLVNCAGVSDGWSSADSISDEEWERVMSINLTVPIRMMKAVLPAMKSQKEGGSIVNVASKAGNSGASAGIAYTASKHGLVCILFSGAAIRRWQWWDGVLSTRLT